MRILLFGKNGQVGKALVPLLMPLGGIVAMGHKDVDVADSNRLQDVLQTFKPELVINAVAYTKVDQAETEKDIAWKVNAEAPGVMMEELNKWKGTLIHFSTDYVFDGMKYSPYMEEDIPNPINEYGRSKYGGEGLIKERGDRYVILRTSWVYAVDTKNFVSNIVRWASGQKEISIVDDQIGSPTWAKMLAEQTARLLIRRRVLDNIDEITGVYHCAGRGAVSRYDLARKVLSLTQSPVGYESTVAIPVKSGQFPSPALRPSYTALDCTKFEKAFDVTLPNWDLSLAEALQGVIA